MWNNFKIPEQIKQEKENIQNFVEVVEVLEVGTYTRYLQLE